MSEPRKDDATDTDAGAAGSATPTESAAAAKPEPPAPATLEPSAVATPPTTATPPTAAKPEPAAATPAAATPAAATPEPPAAAPAGTASAKAPAGRKGLLLGVGGAVALLVILALAAFVWPGFLAGPGNPDEPAAAAAAALGSKNAAELDKVSCHGPDGKTISQLPPEALQLIQAAKPSGPATQVLDTQAQLPIDLTLSAQGQTQNVPASLVFAVDDGKWCLAGLSMRQ